MEKQHLNKNDLPSKKRYQSTILGFHLSRHTQAIQATDGTIQWDRQTMEN